MRPQAAQECRRDVALAAVNLLGVVRVAFATVGAPRTDWER